MIGADTDYRDICITDLSDENALLREANRQLIDLVADVAFDNTVLRMLHARELVERIHGDATIRRLRRRGNKRGCHESEGA